MEEKKPKIYRKFQGTIVSDKMDKTVVVLISRSKMHPRYLKRYTLTNKLKAHDEKNQYKTGDVVEIQECRPLSKDKKWRVIKKIK
ncbi:MAG TPA: 30S ribosomal protein S17 [Candidatus Bipolaricaulota bacterium]|nr:30S ribosomal protein S17 [Candidatus Bipolaricaulota bacterium]